MTSLNTTALQKGILTMLTLRAGNGADATSVAKAVRSIYDDLATALAPLISQSGVDALVGRALHLAAREYPVDHAGEKQAAEPVDQLIRWVERQRDPVLAADAASSAFAKFAGLLAALIGDALTRRYLQKAWPEGDLSPSEEGKQA